MSRKKKHDPFTSVYEDLEDLCTRLDGISDTIKIIRDAAKRDRHKLNLYSSSLNLIALELNDISFALYENRSWIEDLWRATNE